MKASKFFIVLALVLGFTNPASRRALAQEETPVKKTAKAKTKTKAKPAKPKAEELDAETRQVLKLVSEKYKKLKHWEANFTEERTSAALGTGSFSEGKFVFSSPNRFKYTLTGSEASDFISDGKSAWHIRYKEGRDKPAFVRHFPKMNDAELNSYLFILRGIGAYTPKKEKELMRDFKISGKIVENELQLSLEPKRGSELARVLLVFRQNEDVLNKAILESTMGNETTIVLKNYKLLKGAPGAAFKPDYPKGSKVETL